MTAHAHLQTSRSLLHIHNMRTPAAILALACCSCGATPSKDWQNAVKAVDSSVNLPEGTGTLTCYERHYVLLSQRQAQEYLGLPQTAWLKRGLLVGAYIRSADPEALIGKPGIYPAADLAGLPGANVKDRGCSVLTVTYPIGSARGAVSATCGITWDGGFPDRVSPAVSC